MGRDQRGLGEERRRVSDPHPLSTVDPQPQPEIAVSDRLLTDEEYALIRGWHHEGRPITFIARKLDRRWHTIAEAIKRLELPSTVDAARSAAESTAYDRVQKLTRWTNKRDRVGLEAVKELNKVAGLGQEQAQTTVGVQVVIGMPGAPAGPDPLGNHNGPYQTQTESVGLTAQSLTATLRPTVEGESEGRKC
jgi:hypothetical protein